MFYVTASVKLPPEKFSGGSGQQAEDVSSDPKKFILNSGEELYAELRDKNFNAVGGTLSRKAKIITAQFDVSVNFYSTLMLLNNIFKTLKIEF